MILSFRDFLLSCFRVGIGRQTRKHESRNSESVIRRRFVSWQKVRGHEEWVEAFDRVVRRGRLAHAYLFTGPPGIGKRLFAGELAKALLCESPGKTRLEACDQCPACTLVEAGTHPDLIVADRPEEKSELPIEVVRNLCRFLDLKPMRAHLRTGHAHGLQPLGFQAGRLVILDDADDLNAESANCFLKTLEEPPPGAVLTLIGTSADRQLSTIVSRCQQIHFRPLPESVIAKLLATNGIKDSALVQRLARLSGGSMGRAMDLADPALWEFRGRLLQGLSRPEPDGVSLAQAWIRFAEEAGKEAALQRRRAALVLHLLIDFLKDALSVAVGGPPQLTEAEDLDSLSQLANRTGPDRLLQMVERCLEADIQIERNVQLGLVLEALLDALTREPAVLVSR
jgi:DNA polymerase-3 subunit delta'